MRRVLSLLIISNIQICRRRISRRNSETEIRKPAFRNSVFVSAIYEAQNPRGFPFGKFFYFAVWQTTNSLMAARTFYLYIFGVEIGWLSSFLCGSYVKSILFLHGVVCFDNIRKLFFWKIFDLIDIIIHKWILFCMKLC